MAACAPSRACHLSGGHSQLSGAATVTVASAVRPLMPSPGTPLPHQHTSAACMSPSPDACNLCTHQRANGHAHGYGYAMVARSAQCYITVPMSWCAPGVHSAEVSWKVEGDYVQAAWTQAHSHEYSVNSDAIRQLAQHLAQSQACDGLPSQRQRRTARNPTASIVHALDATKMHCHSRTISRCRAQQAHD
jgi:hypothetical protein